MNTYKARGIVLNTVKYGDTSMIVQMLTDHFGRQSYIVQGVRSQRGHGSKLAHFQPMFALEFEGLVSPKSELHRMRDTRNGILLRSIPYDVRKSTIALFMAEVLYRLIGESEANPHLFNFVWGSVEALDALEEGVSNFHLWFLANISRFLGFSPGNEYTPNAWFDMREGLFTEVMPLHDAVIAPGGVVHAAGVALVLHAQLALGVAGLRSILGGSDGLGVLLGFGQIDGDVQFAVLGCILPAHILCNAVAADIVGITAEFIIPVRSLYRIFRI